MRGLRTSRLAWVLIVTSAMAMAVAVAPASASASRERQATAGDARHPAHCRHSRGRRTKDRRHHARHHARCRRQRRHTRAYCRRHPARCKRSPKREPSAPVQPAPPTEPQTQSPAFAGLIDAVTCVGGPGAQPPRYTLRWSPASDDRTPASEIVYEVYQATSPGGEEFDTPSYTTPAGATSYTTPELSSGTTYYFVVRARDSDGNVDGNLVERRGIDPCA